MKILIFVMRYLAYESNTCFATQLANAFRDAGAGVTLCDLLHEGDMGLKLAEYAGSDYDAVIDLNSTLPRAMYGQERFLATIDAPFFDLIVDHPLYHHPILKLPLNNMNVICVDHSHARYIRRYYPHIHSILPIAIPGIHSAVSIPRHKRQRRIFFSGTYYPPQKYTALMEDKDASLASLRSAMAERLLDANAHECRLTPENALMDVMKETQRCDIADEEFRRLLNLCYPAEIYARAVQRLNVLIRFAQSGLPLTICGNDWEESPLAAYPNVQLREATDYRSCVDMIASSAMLLNILPGFTEGSHDRMLTAMENMTPVISDVNRLLRENFTDGEHMLYHNGSVPKGLDLALADDAYLERMAAAANARARQFSSWEAVAGSILTSLKNHAAQSPQLTS